MEELVRFERRGNQREIAFATLVREKPLNSLLLETIDQLSGKINEWLADDSIACIVLDSSSERAFCAGADITVMYRAIKEAGEANSPYAESFFLHEYQLNYTLHTATKPIVAWGNGIVIGGGLGLLGGCSHRVGTRTTRIAMPEITIGLFPDAGGTRFLSRMPDQLGLFAGLTGIHLSASDGLALDLIDVIVEQERKDQVLADLSNLPWEADEQANHRLVSGLLERHQATEPVQTNLVSHRHRISEWMQSCLEADDFFRAFDATPPFGDDKLDAAMATYRKGSPTTARIFVEQMKRAKDMSLADMFRMELVIAYQCIRHADFLEGVRALLIDKDRNPKWKYASASQVPASYLAEHFEPAWSGPHPLAALGT